VRKSAQGQAGPVDGRLADDAFQSAFAADEPHLQRGFVFLVELLDRDDLVLHIYRLNSGPR